MKDIFVEGRTLPEAYHAAILAMLGGQLADCSDWNLKGLPEYSQLECRMTLHVEEPLAEPRISRLGIFGPRELEQYRLEILDGLIDFAVDTLVERDGRLQPLEDYTYHHRMVKPFDQLRFAIEELRRNPQMSSRRAVIGIRDNLVDSRIDSPACLQSIQFFVREGKVDLCALFRSNDFANAFFMNAFGLGCLQQSVAEELGLPAGTYSHTANSMHIYQKDFELFAGYVGRIREESPESLVFAYEGHLKELMDEERPDILRHWQAVRDRYETP